MIKQLLKKIGNCINFILTKEYKFKLVHGLILLWIPFSESLKDPIHTSFLIMFWLLLGVNKEDREKMFEWAQPFEVLMPILIPLIYLVTLSHFLKQ